MPSEITRCRVCGSQNLITILDLGVQELTGVFPKSVDEEITKGPLQLVWCPESGLVQLKHSYDLSELYGLNYGYRSGLNQSMVHHLSNKVNHLLRMYPLNKGDIVVDIGSNDATLLKSYPSKGIKRIGVDPTGDKFRNFYTEDIELISDFFSREAFIESFAGLNAKIITSIAMFYDLEDPISFVQHVSDILADDGIWHFEQSYMPSMLRMNAYDTICHEHLEYYSLVTVNKILEACSLKIIDVQMNAINGGSFAVTAAKKGYRVQRNDPVIDWLIGQEKKSGLNTPLTYRNFEDNVFKHRESLRNLVDLLTQKGKVIFGYGASTKGNVLLQFCGLTAKDIPYIAEINPDKFGRHTPGTHIPIISETDAKAMNPDYFLVLPWHFKHGIIDREQNFLMNGGKLIFPLPEIEIY